MPSDPDKAYVKQHKINDLLNELYLELTKNKPENPVEFAKNHFESKLPPKEPSLLSFKITQEPIEGNDLLGKLFNKNLLGNDTQSAANASNVLSPFVSFNIMNKINRVIVKTNQELTPEEILEKENIVYQRHDDEEEKSQETKANIRYKNDLKNRQALSKHKNNLKTLVETELGIKTNETDEETKVIENYEDDLMDEILTADNIYHVSDKKEKKKKQAELRKSEMPSLSARNSIARNSIAPFVKFMICQFCSRVVEETNKAEETSKVESKDPSVKSSEKQVEEKREEEIQVEKSIFDFFSKNQTSKIDTLDDEIIESASQVSGPRQVEPFEAITNRSETKKDDEVDSSDKDPGIMAWILANQIKKEPKSGDAKSESTLVGSKTSNKRDQISNSKASTSRPTSVNSSNNKSGSNVSARSNSKNLEWKTNLNSSNSDFSTLFKK